MKELVECTLAKSGPPKGQSMSPFKSILKVSNDVLCYTVDGL